MAKKQEQQPASEEITEVSPGILRLQLPIQMPGLGHVNTYALLDDKGAVLVDPGLPGPLSWKALQKRMADAGLGPKAVHTVVVTHSHPDHFGNAGRLAREAGADLVTHESFEVWWSKGRPGRGSTTPWGGDRFRHGVGRRLGWFMMRRVMSHRWSPPVPTKKLADEGELIVGDRRFIGVHTPGHTKDHLCLFDPENGVLLSGDHVLPTITPHIGGMMDTGDPLADFFASLDKVSQLEAGLVLPAHGQPFEDLRGRCKAIHDHHVERLEKLSAAAEAKGTATVSQLSKELFSSRHWGFMAESETYAHLEHLRHLGKAESFTGDDGVLRYRVT